MIPEILAPAGSMEALTAAVRCKADAVYFGTDSFNARRNADNFSGEALKQAIDYCHLHSVKCHITLNTLVSDGEFDEVTDVIRRVCDCRADALIIQDLGVAEAVRQICPDIAMHASTQLSTGTPDGIKLLAELGFSRAVLPRELSLGEIEAICASSPIELEMFVHGALCMSVSGQCLLSAMLGSRSGNRGLCAQPCRLPFSAGAGSSEALSLKDLSLIERIPELYCMGVCSFKIEGRMKRPEYVAAAVTACREAVDGSYSESRHSDLEGLFSRSGFTSGYLDKKLGRAMFGKREKENVTSATGELLGKYERLYDKETGIYPTEFYFTAECGSKPTLSVKAESKSVFIQGDCITEKAVKRSLDRETVSAQLSKCGGTVFIPDKIECDIEEGISLPLSVINAMRREALGRLSELLSERDGYTLGSFERTKPVKRSTGKRKLYVQLASPAQLPDRIECDRLFLPLDTDRDMFVKYKADVAVPRGLFSNYGTVLRQLSECPSEYALCNTLDAVALAKRAGKEIIGGPFLNIFNREALSVMKRLGVSAQTLSYELTAKQISALSGQAETGCVVYGRTPLMLTKNCPVRNSIGCAACRNSSGLTDRKGVFFPVRCENGFSQLFNSRPTYMLDRLDEIRGTDFDMLVFTTETADEVSRIISAYTDHSAPSGEFTRGLFVRGVE